MITCRIDHYQTLSDVHVSVFAKQADKERSVITFEETQVVLSLFDWSGEKRLTDGEMKGLHWLVTSRAKTIRQNPQSFWTYQAKYIVFQSPWHKGRAS